MAKKLNERERAEVVRRYKAGERREDLANEFGTNQYEVRKACLEAGFYREPVYQGREAELESRIRAGMLPKQIANELGVSVTVVRRHAQRIGMKFAKRHASGGSENAKVAVVNPITGCLVLVDGSNVCYPNRNYKPGDVYDFFTDSKSTKEARPWVEQYRRELAARSEAAE